ncbi:gamma-glutamylcyclotransferase family protein [Methylophaga pinxianii]|uniref:gamma-glutamylcyclotransferase family protein n=1 Tax=Methylophaga pinxianii TaxID=2881052 RepID=UPI001CF2D9A5|nr:gamma-glutamylcyclotransferase family protein [Methylophaga pinxianii]MCB2425958.1 gamma-glutamylcyclotransferase [Methylophaga pinxianii]UPH46819.1 gamma-glutamylcyclotransferase [Methylophaga pinxianii]
MSQLEFMTEDYLFVYGTLRKNTARHNLLHSLCEYLDSGTLQGCLYLVGGYPGVVASHDSQQRVVGEVYRIHHHQRLFAKLDDYEECSSSFAEPHEYIRQQQTVTLSNGLKVSAWVYLYNRPATGLKLIASGDFLNP